MSTIAIDNLSPAERLELIADLWDSLDGVDVPVSAAQRDELDRRLRSNDALTSSRTWDEVEASLKDRLK